MKEYLKRDLNKTYLVISSEGSNYAETYEIEMIVKNEPEMLLPFHVFRMNGSLELYYDISAKQTIQDCAQRVKLSFEIIKNLFEALDALMKEIKNFMLDMDCIFLNLEHIYTKEGKFFFCYCPWEKKEILSSFRELLEEILGELDYHDTKAVELAYHLYQKACKGDFCIGEILNAHVEPPQNEEPAVFQDSMPIAEEQPEISFCENRKEVKNPGIFRRIVKFFLKKEEPKILQEEKGFPEESYDRFFPEQIENSSYTELLSSPERGTVLLEDMPAGHWKLRPLVPGSEEFCIYGENFLIGKKRDSVDGFIGRDTISRIHSRLTIREERLFIADANSTNGTFVNGIQIPPGEEVEIFPGDRILFADVGYECYNSL